MRGKTHSIQVARDRWRGANRRARATSSTFDGLIGDSACTLKDSIL